MDSLTHIVLGAAIGEAVLGKHLGKKAMLWGALANTIPDFDMVMNYFAEPVEALVIHRGFTHSLFFSVIIPVKFMFLFSWFSKNIPKYKWLLLFFLGFITHTLLDCMTAYGTGLFEPFNHKRVAFNNMFVADPLYTLPLLVSFIALLVIKKEASSRIKWNLAGILLSSLYILFTLGVKNHVNNTIEKSLAENNIQHSRYFSSPTPLNSLLWMAVAEADDKFYLGYYSVFDKTKTITFEEIPKNNDLIVSYEENELLNTLKYFSNGYYCFTSQNDELFFNDLRFGRVSAWGEPNSKFVFQYKLNKDADNKMILEKGRWNKSSSLSQEFKLLMKRIKGI